MSSPSVRTEGRDGPSRDTAQAEPARRGDARPTGAVASTAGLAVPLDPGDLPAPDATAWQRAGGSPWAVPDGNPGTPGTTADRPAPGRSGGRHPSAGDTDTDPSRSGGQSAAGHGQPVARGRATRAGEAAVRHDAADGSPWPLWADPPPVSGPEPEHGYAADGALGWDDGLIARRAEAAEAVRSARPPADGFPASSGPVTGSRGPVADDAPPRRDTGAAAPAGTDPVTGARPHARTEPTQGTTAPQAGARPHPGTEGAAHTGGARWAVQRTSAPETAAGPHPGADAAVPVRHSEPEGGARPHPGADAHADRVRADVWSETRRRLEPAPAEEDAEPAVAPTALRSVRRWESPPVPDPAEGPLRRRLGALRELIGLSRARVAPDLLAEAAGVLDAAEARGRLSRTHTTIALAGATGSGKSSLINALAERELSPVGTLRPTTAEPVACTWENGRDVAADDLLDRLGIPPRDRRRVRDPRLRGLVLVDLPDHDSLEAGHREQVDRLLRLVDAVVWVVDPEKYADALLHERYLRPMAGHAEVTFVVLNQTDRLPGEATDIVLDDLRRLLDEDGMALGEHGEPGARVLATSALTGDGLAELREELGAFVASRRAPVRRLTADVDGAVRRLRPVYADPAVTGPACLSEQAREEFDDRLAEAVGATAAGQAAERAWLRQAERACGTPWSQLVRWRDARRHRKGRYGPLVGASSVPPDEEPPETAGTAGVVGAVTEPETRVARPVLDQAVRDLADAATAGLPAAWVATVREAARRGAARLPEALEAVLEDAHASGCAPPGAGADGMPRPRWWTAGTAGQGLLLAVQVLGLFWLVGAATGNHTGPTWVAAALLLGGAVGGPLLGWVCMAASRGPARAHGQQEERRLRRLAAGCGRARVLEPVAAELMRYREVREQYVGAAGEG